MSVAERPQLRPYLAASRGSRTVAVSSSGTSCVSSARPRLRLSALELQWLQLFDGERTLREIQAEAIRQVDGQIIPLEVFTRLASPALDEAALPRQSALTAATSRTPSAGRRASAPTRRNPTPSAARSSGCSRGRAVPECRGRAGRTRAFERCWRRTSTTPAAASATPGPSRRSSRSTAASLFVIIGTSHYSRHRRFTPDPQASLKTPLGVVPTDQEYIDRLVKHYGDGLFDDELMAHLPEHSIELEVVFLQYLFEGKRPIRIVPMVVGSFEDAVESGETPSQREDVQQMVEALRAVERETKEPICYVISGDLAHIGPKFGDYVPVYDEQLQHSREQDQAILRQAVAADPAGYFRVIAEEGDRRRICGLPPTYTVLEALRPGSGQLLHYDQYVHPRGYESVSFASVAFYR